MITQRKRNAFKKAKKSLNIRRRRSKRIQTICSKLKPYPFVILKKVCPSHIMLYHEEWEKTPLTKTFETYFHNIHYRRNMGKENIKFTYPTAYQLAYMYESPWERFNPCKIDWDVVYKYTRPKKPRKIKRRIKA
jgi:hypothetical protein